MSDTDSNFTKLAGKYVKLQEDIKALIEKYGVGTRLNLELQKLLEDKPND